MFASGKGGAEAGTENFSEQTPSRVTAMGEQSCGHMGWTVGLCGMQDVTILGRQHLGVSAGGHHPLPHLIHPPDSSSGSPDLHQAMHMLGSK